MVALKRIYLQYTYTVVPIVLGATGLVTNSLAKNLGTLSFKEKDLTTLQ